MTKNNFYPTIDKVYRMFAQADNPNIENRNVRPLMDLLRKISYFSPRISGHILTRRTAIQSFNWRFAVIDENIDTSLVKTKLQSFIDKIIEKYIDAVCYGIFVIPYNYVFEDNFQIPKISATLTPDLLDYQNNDIYYFNQQDGKYYLLDKTNLIYYIYNSSTRGGILRTVLLSELMRYNTLIEWANLNKLLKGIITTLIDPKKLQETKALMRLSDENISTALQNIDDAVQYPDDYNYLRTLNFAETKAQQIADSSSGNSYQSFIDALNNDIAIAFLGQSNTAQLPNMGGSRAALQVLNLIRTDILYADLLNIKSIVDNFLLQFYKLNYNANVSDSPLTFEFIFEDEEVPESNARIFEYLSRIGNVQVNSDEFYNRLRLSKPATIPEVITLGSKTSGLPFGL